LGQKTGAGWFRYEKGDRTPHPDPEVARIIKEKAAETGVEQCSFFSAFGYAMRKDATATPPEKADYLYVEFGREVVPPSPLH
jgi:hypothetical protein